jgi:hypothetical protein
MTDAKVMNIDKFVAPLQRILFSITKRSGGSNKNI